MTINEKLRDIAYTLDCLSIDAADITVSNGYWDGLDRCRDNLEANCDYIQEFLDETMLDQDLRVFIVDQLSRIVEYVRVTENEQAQKERTEA